MGLPSLTLAGALKVAVGATLLTVSPKVVDDVVVPSFADVGGRAAGAVGGTEGAVAGAAVKGVAEAGSRVSRRRIRGAGQRQADGAALVDAGRRVEGGGGRHVVDGQPKGRRRCRRPVICRHCDRLALSRSVVSRVRPTPSTRGVCAALGYGSDRGGEGDGVTRVGVAPGTRVGGRLALVHSH